jgi:hypothetical protein
MTGAGLLGLAVGHGLTAEQARRLAPTAGALEAGTEGGPRRAAAGRPGGAVCRVSFFSFARPLGGSTRVGNPRDSEEVPVGELMLPLGLCAYPLKVTS